MEVRIFTEPKMAISILRHKTIRPPSSVHKSHPHIVKNAVISRVLLFEKKK